MLKTSKTLKYLNEVGDFIPEAIVAVDSSWKIAVWNSAMEQMTGINRKNVLGCTSSELTGNQLPNLLLNDCSIPEYHEKHDERTAGKNNSPNDYLVQRMNRKISGHLMGRVSLIYESGKLSGAVEMICDIPRTEERKHSYTIGTKENTCETLKKSERIFEYLFNYASDAIFIHALHGNFLEVNDVACKRLGYNKEELKKMSPQDIDSPEFADHVPERIKIIKAYGEYIFEAAHVRSNGTVIPVEVSSRIIEYRGNKAVLSIARDITERKEAERRINEEKNRSQAYLEVTGIMIVVLDSKGKVELINRKGTELLGVDENQVVGKEFVTFCIPEKERFKFQSVFDTRRQQKTERFETDICAQNKNTRTILWDYFALKNSDQEDKSIVLSGMDITQFNATIEKLRESEQKYRHIFEMAASFIWIIDKEGTILDCNSQAERILEYSQHELIGKTTKDIFSPAFRIKAQRAFITIFRNGYKYGTELKMVKKSGKEIDVSINSAALKDTQGSYNKAICIINDITQYKKIQRELERSNRQLAQNTEAIFQTISRIVEFRDPYTAGHQEKVAELASEIARQMHLPKDAMDGIYFAGLIHDVGKIYVPSEILSKPGRLNDLEFEMIKKHPEIGNEILKDIEFSWDIAQIILQHHERIDGSGYPFGLTDSDILLEAKIIAVADVFEAMSSHRPYRPSLGKDKALRELYNNSGIKFDSDVVSSCRIAVEQVEF